MASKAADWMARYRDAQNAVKRIGEEEAPHYTGGGSVHTSWAGSILAISAMISDPADAVTLGRWLIDTFAEPDVKETPHA